MLPLRERLETERLTLRPFEEKDLEDMTALFVSAGVKRTYMLPDIADGAAAAELFSRYLRMAPARLCYAVCLKGRAAGFIHEVRREGDEMEVGYALRPEYWDHGYMTEALGAVIAELFRAGFERVIAGYFEGNAASRRVMEKNGMRPLDREERIPYRGEIRRCLYLGVERRRP